MITPNLYGLTMAASVAVGYFYSKRVLLRLGIARSVVDNGFTFVVIFGFVGARFYHVLSEPLLYAGHWLDVLKVWQGGLSIFGALLGGLVGLFVFLRFSEKGFVNAGGYKFTFLDIAGYVAPVLPFCQALGRLGNYFNQELYGRPTSLPWGISIEPQNRLLEYVNFSHFHPWFLYESLLNLVSGAVLVYLAANKKSPKLLLGCYFLFYGVIRFMLEPLRVDSLVYFGIHLNMLTSLGLCVVGLVLVKKGYTRQNT